MKELTEFQIGSLSSFLKRLLNYKQDILIRKYLNNFISNLLNSECYFYKDDSNQYIEIRVPIRDYTIILDLYLGITEDGKTLKIGYYYPRTQESYMLEYNLTPLLLNSLNNTYRYIFDKDVFIIPSKIKDDSLIYYSHAVESWDKILNRFKGNRKGIASTKLGTNVREGIFGGMKKLAEKSRKTADGGRHLQKRMIDKHIENKMNKYKKKEEDKLRNGNWDKRSLKYKSNMFYGLRTLLSLLKEDDDKEAIRTKRMYIAKRYEIDLDDIPSSKEVIQNRLSEVEKQMTKKLNKNQEIKKWQLKHRNVKPKE